MSFGGNGEMEMERVEESEFVDFSLWIEYWVW